MKKIREAAKRLAIDGEHEQVQSILLASLSQEKTIIAYHNLADLLKEDERFNEALYYARKAVAMQPQTYYPYALLGELYMQAGQIEEAQQWLEYAYTLYESPVVAHNLAYIYKRQRRLSEAASYFIRSYETEDYGLQYAVECFILADDLANAQQWVEVIKHDKERFIGAVELAELYARLGQYAEAAKWYREGYDSYAHCGEWIEDYVWVLHQLEDKEQINAVRTAFIEEMNAELANLSEEAQAYEWTAEEIQEEECRLKASIERVKVAHLQVGIVSESRPYIASRCFTFFCPMHDQGFGEQEVDV
ncbi:tetratricopeptide repeat protein [Lysinibacillus sp. FSL H8-0500]|uniref:tetratricopeptide repeat protein n=1 Tax=Lysinibacillus sp. FSL H8-0500 TaxID=2921393 RepID=UPI0031015C69